MQLHKDIYVATALKLISVNGKTTTLEVKNYLRNVLPNFISNQDDVSEALSWNGDELLSFTDNGTYKTYTLKPIKNFGVVSEIVNLTAKKFLKRLDNLVKENVTVNITFLSKKKGLLREMDCTLISSDLTGLITVEENKEYRSFYAASVISFIENGVKYQVL